MVIFNTNIIKSTKIIITIITHIIVVIIVTLFCNMRKNNVFDVQKKLYNLPEWGGGPGGRGIWAMSERKVFSYGMSSLNLPVSLPLMLNMVPEDQNERTDRSTDSQNDGEVGRRID